MQRVYMHSTEHFEVFTTVLAPQGRCRYRAEAEMMAVVHSYKPQWPDELELLAGDVILVLSKHEEERWFGRLQGGQRGYFPASCVMELSQVNLTPRARRRSSSLRTPACEGDSGVRPRNGSGQALRRGGGGGGWDTENEDHVQARRPQISALPSLAPQPQAHRSPGLLHRILSKCRRKSECQGATNGAFEGD
ncbi:jouberin isoform X1 [Takifugu flavidus]|nr:jouberin isoform X1 [Takifugu flavidus]TWW71007.1 hypothetical protein D4764_17G0004900 [Takifugu flavidus]